MEFMLWHKNNDLEAICFEIVIFWDILFVEQDLEFAFGVNTGNQK